MKKYLFAILAFALTMFSFNVMALEMPDGYASPYEFTQSIVLFDTVENLPATASVLAETELTNYMKLANFLELTPDQTYSVLQVYSGRPMVASSSGGNFFYDFVV